MEICFAQKLTILQQLSEALYYGAFPPWRGLSGPCRVGPVFGCVSTMPSSGPGLLFHLFSGPTKSWFYRGQQTGLSRAEFAKLGKGATTTTR